MVWENTITTNENKDHAKTIERGEGGGGAVL
jgi:hypothetical protein